MESKHKWYILNMTSNTTPSPYVASSSSVYSGSSAFYAFDGSLETYWGTLNNTITGWIKIDFGMPTAVDAFSIGALNNSPNLNALPRNFAFYGSNDDSNYFELINITNQTGWYLGEKRIFELTSEAKYKYYRLNITANNGNAFSTWIGELNFGKKLFNKILISSTDEVNSINYNLSDLVPQMTSNTAPSGVASANSAFSSELQAWKAFNKTSSTYQDCWATAGTTGWLQYEFPSPVTINEYRVTSRTNVGNVSYQYPTESAPRDWIIQGSNDGTTFNNIHQLNGVTSWREAETKIFELDDKFTYKIFRISILSNNGHSAYTTIGDLSFFFRDDTLVNLESATEENYVKYGINLNDKILINRKLSKIKSVDKTSSSLGSGKVFSKSFDTSKTPIKNISII